MKLFISLVLSGLVLYGSCRGDTNTLSKALQLKELQKKQILVPMWGWESGEIGPAAKEYGYEVVNQPQNNEILKHAKDIPVWIENNYDMIVRPNLFAVKTPFDPDPMYLPSAYHENFETVSRVLYSVEYLLAHRDEDSLSGNYQHEFKALTRDDKLGKIAISKMMQVV